MTQVTFRIEFDEAGKAVVRVPEGRKLDVASAAKLTEAIAKALGKIEERHIGDHHHHHGQGHHDHVHETV